MDSEDENPTSVYDIVLTGYYLFQPCVTFQPSTCIELKSMFNKIIPPVTEPQTCFEVKLYHVIT